MLPLFKPGPPATDVASPKRIVLPVPFPLKTVNAWLFQGSGDPGNGGPALVDCGVGSSVSYAALHEGLAEAGQAPEGLRLFITHGHVDHAGNARRLRDDHGVLLHAPRVEAPYVETFRRDSPARNDKFALALIRNGMPADIVAGLREDSQAVDRFLDDVPIEHDLPGGTRLLLGGTEAEAVIAPGHTPGSTVFVTEDNDLLTGDTLLEHITSNCVELLERDHGNFHRYVQSIDSLRRYAGCQALPGHHDPFEVTEELIDRHLGWHGDRAAKILGLLHRPKSAFQVMNELFPDELLARRGQQFMAMAEVVGHLHALELDGLTRRTEGGGVATFERRAI